jgi:hypothetical protein
MAKLKLNNIISDIFADYSYVIDGLEWIFDNHELTWANIKEAEDILKDLREAFAGTLDKRKLAKINIIWKNTNSFIGVCPAELYYPHRPSAKGKTAMIEIEKGEGKINLIDISTGEIKQRSIKE